MVVAGSTAVHQEVDGCMSWCKCVDNSRLSALAGASNWECIDGSEELKGASSYCCSNAILGSLC